ncbi:von Willebrand factor type A [Gracilaria domingensis]|nr:von Willebrand factor type A [Gracilaria domingensis]
MGKLRVNLKVKLNKNGPQAFEEELEGVDVGGAYAVGSSVEPFSTPGNGAGLIAADLLYKDKWSVQPTETGTVKVNFPYIRAKGANGDLCCGSIEGEIDYGSGKVTKKFKGKMGEKEGEDIALVIDSTGSMSDDIEQVRSFSRNLVSDEFAKGVAPRFAVVEYNDPDSRVVLPLSSNQEDIINAINNGFEIRGGGDIPEHAFSGIRSAINLNWRTCAVRRSIVMGDAPPKDPEPITDLEESDILDMANSVDVFANGDPFIPLSARFATVLNTTYRQLVTSGERIRVKVPGAHPLNMILIGKNVATERSFKALADGTGGKLFRASGAEDIVEVLTEAISESTPDPTPSASPSPTASASPRPEITNTEDLVASLLCGSTSDPEFKVLITNPNPFPVKFSWRDFVSGSDGGGIVSPPSTVVSVKNEGGK